MVISWQHDAFAIETLQELQGSNPPVPAFIRKRTGDGDSVLCVNNLSRFSQPIELNLPYWTGYTPVELIGQVDFRVYLPTCPIC